MVDKLALINNLLATGSFNLSGDDIIEFKKISDILYGDNPIMYSIYFEGLSLSIVVLDEENIYAEQIEVVDYKKIKSNWIKLNLEFSLNLFKDNYFESIYGDDNEMVVFLKNHVTVYYNKIHEKYLLSKIIGKHEASRKLVKEVLTKIK